MSKTWYGHHIETIKSYDYVEYKDYLELDKKIDELQQENKQLKERIDKALKMVSNEKYLHIERLEKIKDILGDKENVKN